MKRLLKKNGLSVVLALSLIAAPYSSAYAKTTSVQPSTQKETAVTKAVALADTAKGYDEVQKVAEAKATALTTFYGTTSVQYALIDNGTIVLSGQSGVFSKDSKTPLTDTKMYGIGSISKVFTTVAVMQLVEQGKVTLDTPVVDYIPEFTMADPRYKNITVRMLLNHSSGLMGSTLSNAMLFGNDTTTYENFLNSLKTSRLKADPGAFSVYCNDGFTLAEVLVEKVTGKTFTDYMKENISTPLNLYNTKTPNDKFQTERLAKAYVPNLKETLPVESLNAIGAGGIYSSAENLCEFARIFMDSSTSSVLSKSSAAAMENKEFLRGLWPEEADNILNYGLGWDGVDTYPFNDYGIKALSKGGDTILYHGNLTVLPDENMAVAVLSSGGSSAYDQVMAQEILLQALKTKGTIKEIKPYKTFDKPVQASIPESFKQYEGIYATFNNIMKIAINKNGKLTLTSVVQPETGKQEFLYTGDGKFYFSDGSTYLSFVTESNGNTYLCSNGYSMLPGLGQTAASFYQAQKLKDNPISPEVKKAWEKRNGKFYYIVSEKYNSEYYIAGSLVTSVPVLKDVEGYCFYASIIDKDYAKANIQIPGVFGRDLSDFKFFTKAGAEYLKGGEYVYISEDAVKPLSSASGSVYHIDGDGYAKWCTIDKKTANKTIKVKLPKNASFAVYDENGACTNYSYVTKKNTVKLPLNGYIVFSGSKNSEFTVDFVK